MMCVRRSFIKELDEIVSDVQSTSDEFRSEICHAKCQVTKLVRMQIQRLKGRKDLFHTGSNPTFIKSYEINQGEAFSDPSNNDDQFNNDINDIFENNETADIEAQHLAEAKNYTENVPIFNPPPETTEAFTNPFVYYDQFNNHINDIFENDINNDTTYIGGQHFSEAKNYTEPGPLFTEPPETIHVNALNPEEQVITGSVGRSFEALRRLPRFSKNTKKIISALVIGFVVWISLVYGALVGASVCSSGYCFLTSSRRPTVF